MFLTSLMNMDNPGELMKVFLRNSEARKVLGAFIEDAITKDHASTIAHYIQISQYFHSSDYTK